MLKRLVVTHWNRLLWAMLLLVAGVGWALVPEKGTTVPTPKPATLLASGIVASMDSPVFQYDCCWHVSPQGADTVEPDDPWQEPSGRLSFDYTGRDLALELTVGDYWGYIYVRVDGQPANRLPSLIGNLDSRGRRAGYKPLLAPEQQTPAGPAAEWYLVHRAETDGPHHVEIELWRGWGQTVLRGAAVDVVPPNPRPNWPGVALILLAGWIGLASISNTLSRSIDSVAGQIPRRELNLPRMVPAVVATTGVLLIGSGVLTESWLLTDAGLVLLGLAGLVRPLYWTSTLLLGLPFYLIPLPILPGRGLNLIEVGVYGGLAVCGVHWALQARSVNGRRTDPSALLFVLVGLALISALAADQRTVALREWRTLFLAAAGFSLLLQWTRLLEKDSANASTGLALAWLAGGTTVALVGIWQYFAGQNLIEAEGVNRVRAFYGSPNNLALYLDRTAAVGLALLIFAPWRVGPSGQRTGLTLFAQGLPAALYALLSVPQLLALLLTFSKGALFLALPAMLLTLAFAGRRLLVAKNMGTGRLWGLAAVAVGMGTGLLPFLGADRFRALLDFRPESTGGVRLNLWKSSLAMALDHPWLGVGPDNFLYKYRSGYILPAAWRDPSLNHPHNMVLDWWTRLGLPGLVVAASWLWTGIRLLWYRATSEPLAVGALGAIAAGLAHGLIDASYALPDLFLSWVLLLHLFLDGLFGAKTAESCPEE